MRALCALLVLVGCGAAPPYPAPPPRSVPQLSPTSFGPRDDGDAPAMREAERSCRAELSPSMVSASFRAVDRLAEVLVEYCSISLVEDDPLLWHLDCRSDATFASGSFRPPNADPIACGDGRAANAFECIGRLMADTLLDRSIRRDLGTIEIVAVGSVDLEPVGLPREGDPEAGTFVRDPCPELQQEVRVAEPWAPFDPEAGEDPPDLRARSGVWNTRLSWCRAAFASQGLRRGLSQEVGGDYRLAAVGAGTDWLDSWRRRHRGRLCPSPSDDRRECADARRVDLYVRIDARQGRAAPRRCEPPEGLPGQEPGESLYCYVDCQTRRSIGRDPQGVATPPSRSDRLFGGASALPAAWIGPRPTRPPLNGASVRQLLLR
jgi:hypothetical protein